MLAGWRVGDFMFCRIDLPIEVRGRPGPSPMAADGGENPPPAGGGGFELRRDPRTRVDYDE